MIGISHLIVFIDNLDRCRVDTSIEILESVKLFLQAKNAVYIIALDMRMLERAWELRYQNPSRVEFQARDYIDKQALLRN